LENLELRIENIELKENAVIIADVHYKKGDTLFLELLKSWNKNPPPQVFFLGDIFHLLLPFDFLINYNKDAIELINTLSQKTDVLYTPGNHDFNIESIFTNVKIADAFVDEKKSIFLTHGDLTDKDFFYKTYVKVIRNSCINKILNLFTFNFINNWLFKRILKKTIKCNKISYFKEKVFYKTADINYKVIIEGHYHQHISFDFGDKKYYNLGAFVCNTSYSVYKNNFLKDKTYDIRR